MGWILALVVSAVFVAAQPIAAAPADFPKPGALRPQIDFWKRVFTEWSEYQVAIHDAVHLDKVYTVVDVQPLAASGVGDVVVHRERRRRTESEKKRIDAILRRLHARQSPKGLSAEERRIYDLFANVSDRNRFSKARQEIRAQQGLRERFRRGVEISARYLPRMEEIFRGHGLPTELTRIPFVESTFNVKAYSKVGAAGIWQFIPSSARIYGLRMNEVVDERRDPLLATAAAAKHLRDDYAVLEAWPLAVTAYNHGRAGIARAVRTVGGRDLPSIIRRYKGRSFGFASRNFYTSFLAALEVEADAEKHFGKLERERPFEFDEVPVRDYVPFATLAGLIDAEPEVFHDLNPAFERVVVDGKLYVPKGYPVRVPAGEADRFRAAYDDLPAAKRYAAQRHFFIEHRVARGQTVGAIARRYRTTAAAIKTANNLQSYRIRIGQVLKIPSGRGAASISVARAEKKQRVTRAETRPRFVSHRVRKGQTVGQIARRYGTTVAKIKAANRLGSVHKIRPGQVLKIPSG